MQEPSQQQPHIPSNIGTGEESHSKPDQSTMKRGLFRLGSKKQTEEEFGDHGSLDRQFNSSFHVPLTNGSHNRGIAAVCITENGGPKDLPQVPDPAKERQAEAASTSQPRSRTQPGIESANGVPVFVMLPLDTVSC